MRRDPRAQTKAAVYRSNETIAGLVLERRGLAREPRELWVREAGELLGLRRLHATGAAVWTP